MLKRCAYLTPKRGLTARAPRLQTAADTAGSGKTTALVAAVNESVFSGLLSGGRRVLALTKMHGSRRRMHERLQGQAALKGAFDCMVLDSFAWQLVRRWRSLAAAANADVDSLGYDAICDLAGALLERPNVAQWVARHYAALVVDELQDSKAGQLRVLRALSNVVTCYLAGDGFQDLAAEGENEALTWAKSVVKPTQLQTIHRTKVEDILAVATALRSGAKVVGGTKCTILQAPKKDIAASFLANNMTWWWSAKPDIVILSPTGPAGSPFVRETLERLSQEPFRKNGKSVGPFKVPWERSLNDEQADVCEAFGLGDDGGRIVGVNELRDRSSSGLALMAVEWLENRRRLTGVGGVTGAELRALVERLVQARRAHRGAGRRSIRAMTIHQAKNREFDYVIVLWPFQVAGGAERRRRLLYNAVTRARKQVLIVVQDPKRTRLAEPPFVP